MRLNFEFIFSYECIQIFYLFTNNLFSTQIMAIQINIYKKMLSSLIEKSYHYEESYTFHIMFFICSQFVFNKQIKTNSIHSF